MNQKPKKRLAILASGGGSNFQAIIDSVNSGEINGRICVLICSNSNAYALKRAEENNIASCVLSLKDYKNARERDAEILKVLEKFDIDYVILAGYLGILSPSIIATYRNKVINIHPSLLPRHGGHMYHGINVHQAVIAAKDPFAGATVHFVDDGIDTGLIIDSKSIEVLDTDTAETLQEKVLTKIEHKLFVSVIKDLCDDKIRVENDKVIYDKK